MAEPTQQPPAGQKKIPVEFPAQLKGGVYANNMMVMHTREEFILDYLMVGPNTGAVTARVIMSPGHMKRMIAALQENMGKYEQKYGSLTPAEEPKGHVGFLKE
ncbi:MAG: DUF3467 domain-containing protein [Dehalococcoidia bacterium]|nr:DUF3467 domain-containing protein [Dehalococcoidia bacterium]